jgi:hypothetical protein
VNDPHWTHLFIDEAAQATEPETLIPLSVVVDPEPGTRKVEICLVGDPRQLSPDVYSERDTSHSNRQADLTRSWMERLLLRPVSALGGGQSHLLGPDLMKMEAWMEYSCRENLSVFLTLNYRGHPSFLMMPSALFYFDKLQSAYIPHPTISSWCPTLRVLESLSMPVSRSTSDSSESDGPAEIKVIKQYDWPIHFRGVIGQDKSITISEGYTSQSWTNEQEAAVVVRLVQTLIEEKVPMQSIGVMAAFRGQVVRIRELLRFCSLSGINVGTIEDYQSVERDVIVLSLTRGTPEFVSRDVASRVGVFGQPKRSNVAMTRAEHLFIVVSTSCPGSNIRQRVQSASFSHIFFGGGTNIGWKPCTHGTGPDMEAVSAVLLPERLVLRRLRRDNAQAPVDDREPTRSMPPRDSRGNRSRLILNRGGGPPRCRQHAREEPSKLTSTLWTARRHCSGAERHAA